MSRAARNGAAIAVTACLCAAALRVAADDRERPNLLLISIDTLRADHTSTYGYGRDTTPGLSAVAAEGTLFSVAYAPVAATAPSHATIFTGNHPVTHGLVKNGLPLPEESRTLAEILASAGYQTAAVVSSFVLDERFGFAAGFAEYQDDFDPETATVRLEEWAGRVVPAGFDRRADATTRRAIRWLWDGRDAKRPFFLFVHYFDPHSPYEPPPGWKGRFLRSPWAQRGVDDLAKDPDYRREVSEYDAEIAFTDAQLARLLDEFDRLGLRDSTLVAVTSDHGEGLREHGVWLHGSDVFEEAVRIPLVLRWPGHVPAGRRVEAPVDLSDLAPTLLDLLGVRPDGLRFDGRSLAAFLRGQAELDVEHPVFLYRSRYPSPVLFDDVVVVGEQYGVRAGSLKFIDDSEPGADALYDLAKDPDERHNLIGSADGDHARLRAVLDAWRRSHPGAGAVEPLAPEVREALEALGYAP